MDDSDAWRDAIHAAIQDNAPLGREAALTGWVLVSEWMDHDGERWISLGHAASKAKWEADGMLFQALHGDWPDGED